MEDDVLTFQARSEPALAKPMIRRAYRRFTYPAAALGVLAAAWYAVDGEPALGTGLMAMAIGVAEALPWQAASQIAGRDAEKLSRMMSYRVDRTGIHTVLGFDQGSVPWSRIRRILIRPTHVDIRLRDGHETLLIPTSGLTAGRRDLLLRLLAARDR